MTVVHCGKDHFGPYTFSDIPEKVIRIGGPVVCNVNDC
jgi:hypothetical protein